jgi:hypothetical protein
VSDIEGVRPSRSQAGLFDRNILCKACESCFLSWDDYGYKLLTTPFDDSYYMVSERTVIGYSFPNVDYPKAKLFFISMLWRASVSALPFFDAVRLGKFEDSARSLILNAEPGEPEQFAVALFKFVYQGRHPGFLSPNRIRVEGVSFYRFYFGDYMALIKVDRRTTPDPYASLILRPSPGFVVTFRPFDNSPELSAFARAALLSKGRLQSNERM